MAQQIYATITQFQSLVDRRALGNLGSDDRNEGILDDENPIVMDCLRAASADIETHSLRGGRYTLEDLANLADTSTDGSNPEAIGDWSLIRLTCDLAAYYLVTRRIGGIPDALQDRVAAARQALTDLKNGELVFRLDGAIAAGAISVDVISISERDRGGMVSDEPYFPRRRSNTV